MITPLPQPAPPGVGAYTKGLTALLGVLGVLYVGLRDGYLAPEEVASAVLSLLGAIIVIAVRNRQAGALRYAKGIAAFCTAAAAFLPQAFAHYQGGSSWPVLGMPLLQVVIASIVVVVPNVGAQVAAASRAAGIPVLDVAAPTAADDSGEDVVPVGGLTGVLPRITDQMLTGHSTHGSEHEGRHEA